ncbi:hypothetical protein IJ090_02325 [Candidatus Saccharibacteria bacterium]|nr:hypothetical protein [Candidatus Saccharibacteria bacterium]
MKNRLIVILVALLSLLYVVFGIRHTSSKVVKEYELTKISDGEVPIYVSHKGIGYYCTYISQDGGETSEFISGEKVRDVDVFTTDGSTPRIEYTYNSGTYSFKYPGGVFTTTVKPYLDSVRFLVPEGAIAEL